MSEAQSMEAARRKQEAKIKKAEAKRKKENVVLEEWFELKLSKHEGFKLLRFSQMKDGRKYSDFVCNVKPKDKDSAGYQMLMKVDAAVKAGEAKLIDKAR